ncbi:single-stranded DNA-binding protein [Liquorilactobacillus satsumensis]|nr:single-stranded DNA-binding protein [Liquorilactobacillus satsumensis]MCP9328724.1 DUF1413 domain-containing protein [Liquorilactobacillus satsumensis]
MQEMKAIFTRIEEQLKKQPSESQFSLPELYGEADWQQLYIGTRVQAGNLFRREVLAGHYPTLRLLATKDRK